MAACAPKADPAAGGLLSGVAGVAGGGYQARVDERQATVDDLGETEAAAARQAAEAEAQVAANAARIEALELDLARSRAAIRRALEAPATIAELPPAEAQAAADFLRQTSADRYAGLTPDARIAALSEAISGAAELADRLAAIGAL
ncbi:hypothetical protein SAMN05444370_103294 [Rubrimonas cliftonensis]|uniref:Uncharacterized protein n=2 Tax=Rubrimonas cliftonensis TaxID=89524 RepID=A0A1H3YXU4_9RHOB|nr:hypothetical protein SAMN05444370_103294 [Rubrimonas cliftonensis]